MEQVLLEIGIVGKQLPIQALYQMLVFAQLCRPVKRVGERLWAGMGGLEQGGNIAQAFRRRWIQRGEGVAVLHIFADLDAAVLVEIDAYGIDPEL